MFVTLLAAFSIICVIAAGITFILYGRARMKEQEQKEKLFLKIHYACLCILLLLGLVFMFFMVETAT